MSGAREDPRVGGRAALGAIAAFAFLACLRKVNDLDYWTHLAFGRAYARAGTLSIGDPFVLGRGAGAAPLDASGLWHALTSSGEWPFQLGIHAVQRALGHEAVSVAMAACAALAAALLAAPVLRPATPGRRAAVVTLAAAAFFVARFRFAPRPEVPAAVLLGGVLLLALEWGRNPRWRVLAGIALLLVAWRPLHPSWAIGMALAGTALVAAPRLDFWRRQPLALRLGAAAAAALLALPAARFALFVARELSGGVLVAVTEMRPTWEFPGIAIPFVALAGAAGALAWGRPEGRPARLALSAAALLLGLVVVRNVGLAALALIPAAAAGAPPPTSARPRRAAHALAAAALLALGVLVARDRDCPFGVGVDWRVFPRDAAEFVKSAGLGAPVYNSWDWGGYLAWAWDGAPRTFLDGRLGDEQRMADHDAIESGDPGPVVERYGFRTALVRSIWNNSGRLLPVVPWLLGNPEWRLVRATDGLVFARAPLPAGMEPLPSRDAWRVVLREAELALEQGELPPDAPFTRSIALLQLGARREALEAFEQGRRASPEVASRYAALGAAVGAP
ncbi:MAG TPA: hypothetical protein VF875_01395 [Anaeromyxobacter sp.]